MSQDLKACRDCLYHNETYGGWLAQARIAPGVCMNPAMREENDKHPPPCSRANPKHDCEKWMDMFSDPAKVKP